MGQEAGDGKDNVHGLCNFHCQRRATISAFIFILSPDQELLIRVGSYRWSTFFFITYTWTQPSHNLQASKDELTGTTSGIKKGGSRVVSLNEITWF